MEIHRLAEGHGRPAIQFCCARCAKTVVICQCCWRNQKYCSAQCSRAATRERHRRNQKAYRMTETGRKNHLAQQRSYRARKKIEAPRE